LSLNKFRIPRLFPLLFVIVFVLAMTSSPALGEVSVKPLSVRLTAGAGETASGTIQIRNRSEQPTRVRLRTVDWWRTEKGDLQILPPGSRERSSTDWTILSPGEFELDPDERIEVTVEATVPEGASGDHWSMILVTEEPVNPEEASGMQISVGYAVKILVSDPNSQDKQGKITNVEVKSTNPIEMSITYENTGEKYTKTEGSVEIRNLQGETEKEFEISEFPTLPAEEHILTVRGEKASESLSPGQYYAIVVLDYGGDKLIQGGLPFTVPEAGEKNPKDQSN